MDLRDSRVTIHQLDQTDFLLAADLIRASFATVAEDLGLNEQNCPKYVGFVTTADRLQNHHNWGWWIYGLYENEQLIGYVSISREADSVYEIHNLAILPVYRHKGYGRKLLDFCMAKVVELGGNKVTLSIIEENTVLKNWYSTYGFVHTGTKKFEHLPFTSGYMELELS
jgi:ribosomal protein S18 acetylase RimI-like enzyme